MTTHTKPGKAEHLAYHLDGQMSSARATLDKFEKQFATDPSYAFSWGAEAFKAAARHKVALQIQAWIRSTNTDATFEERLASIIKELRAEVMRKAKWPEHSTSATSNLMALEMNSANAEMLETLERL
jgi:hypothetical protein